jgi:hypothetical protein
MMCRRCGGNIVPGRVIRGLTIHLDHRRALPPITPGLIGRYALCRLGLLDIACVSARVCYAVSTAPQAYGASPVPRTPHAPPGSIWMTRDGEPAGPGSSSRRGWPATVTATPGSSIPTRWSGSRCLSSGLCRAGGGHLLGGHLGFAYTVLVTHGPGRPWACAVRSHMHRPSARRGRLPRQHPLLRRRQHQPLQRTRQPRVPVSRRPSRLAAGRLCRPARLLRGGRSRHHPRPAVIPPAPPVTKMCTAASRRRHPAAPAAVLIGSDSTGLSR